MSRCFFALFLLLFTLVSAGDLFGAPLHRRQQYDCSKACAPLQSLDGRGACSIPLDSAGTLIASGVDWNNCLCKGNWLEEIDTCATCLESSSSSDKKLFHEFANNVHDQCEEEDGNDDKVDDNSDQNCSPECDLIKYGSDTCPALVGRSGSDLYQPCHCQESWYGAVENCKNCAPTSPNTIVSGDDAQNYNTGLNDYCRDAGVTLLTSTTYATTTQYTTSSSTSRVSTSSTTTTAPTAVRTSGALWAAAHSIGQSVVAGALLSLLLALLI